MTRPPGFDREMLACWSKLMTFAQRLSRNTALAEDLVQRAMVRAMEKAEQFEPDTNMLAWLFTILRNDFLTGARRRRREVEDPEGVMASILPTPAGQAVAYDLKLVLGYMERLSFEQRASLELVGMDGMSYEQVGAILEIPPGTVKSQVHRARARLVELCGGRP